MALVPEVGLDGLALGPQRLVEVEGVGQHVLASSITSFRDRGAVPQHERIGLGVVYLDDHHAVVKAVQRIHMGHDAQGLHVVGQRVAAKETGLAPLLAIERIRLVGERGE